MKTDCFAYRNGRCIALIEKVCENGDCAFYKTTEQVEAERNRSKERLRLKKKKRNGEYARTFKFNGQAFSKKEFAEYLGISYSYLFQLLRDGKSLEEIGTIIEKAEDAVDEKKI